MAQNSDKNRLSSDPRGGFFHQVRCVVECIPSGKVATYGQVAALAGNPRAARMVGWALASLPRGSNVPWQRVINAQGRISLRGGTDGGMRQRLILEAEGVQFRESGTVDLARFQWHPELDGGCDKKDM